VEREAELAQPAVDVLEVLRRAGLRDVEDVQPLTPVFARVGAGNEPVGVLPREAASLADEERCGPDSRYAA
jgi:hypothetical protein